ncbi:hypothetical protein J3F83DRAFT_763086 [Trichoderma novae-zelandiae]
MNNSYPDHDPSLMMDPVEFWSSQVAPQRPSSAASQRLSVRSASMDRDDPLHAAPLARFKSSDRSEARQPRIAVVLKSPAYVNKPASSQGEGGGQGGTWTAATASAGASPASFSSSSQQQHAGSQGTKKETPVPIPKPLGSTSRPTTAASSLLRTPVPVPVPVPKPMAQTVTQRTAPATAPTPVPLPKHFTTTLASAATDMNANTNPAIMAPIPVRSQAPVRTPAPVPIPAPASAPQPSSGRGRPRGWKPGMSYSSLRGPASERAAATRPARPAKPKPIVPFGYAKRRGRPPKAPSPLPWQVYRSLQTSFVAFLCEWSGCKAELHNLDTLRRHVSVVHCRKAPFICRWGACAQMPASACEFPDEPSLQEHVEDAHLVPFSWHVGDGPRNSGGPVKHPLEDDEVPDYLKDEQGNQVTPSIRDQGVEDFATFKQNRQKLKDLLVQLNENLPSEESDSPVDND